MQNPIDTVGALFLNHVRTNSEKCSNFTKMLLSKMSEFQFPMDSKSEHWHKISGHDLNFMVKHKANINSFFIVANQYFELSLIIINSKGNIVVLNETNSAATFEPFSKDVVLYIYSRNKRKDKNNIAFIKSMQNEIETQKIKNLRKGKKVV